ncbi:MAG: prephenate dehydrogenase/arogenate dehydrogenase family protein [Oscillospiraceae bacterium]|nr:prephenate dehydrogenase/arogenate dehydrogenase family protein [Oscillospiraceae bacterium]
MNFNTVGFIGLGLIGGSIARKIKINIPSVKILASARRQETIDTAFGMKLIDNQKSCDITDFSECDYIFLCAPVKNNIDYLHKLKDVIREDCIITDVGSTKTEIHEEVTKLGLEKNFIGGHPMTGSEKTGIENADEYLLENAYYIITPTEQNTQEQIEDFRSFVKSLGSIPLILDYRKHDYATASISHLPHMISYALTNLVKKIDDSDETMKTIAAGGFRDMTRIAASSPVMWQSICLSNKEQLLSLMDLYIEEITVLRKSIENSDKNELLNYFQEAKDYRDSLFIPSKRSSTVCYELFIDLVDEAGGIAIIASMLAFKGINIKNIGIINNREYEEGVLRIEFYSHEACELAAETLREKNYNVFIR